MLTDCPLENSPPKKILLNITHNHPRTSENYKIDEGGEAIPVLVPSQEIKAINICDEYSLQAFKDANIYMFYKC